MMSWKGAGVLRHALNLLAMIRRSGPRSIYSRTHTSLCKVSPEEWM